MTQPPPDTHAPSEHTGDTPAQPSAADTDQSNAVAVEHLSFQFPPGRPSRRKKHSAAPGHGDAPAGEPPRAVLALDDVSFQVPRGEVFGVLGPNGSGKTTLFRILSTLLRPAQGRVRVLGHDLAGEPHLVRAQLGVVFQMPSLDIKLTARENMLCQGRLYGLGGRKLREKADHLLEQAGLLDRADAFVETFSGGMRRRVELAKAMLHDPPLLLLDEPSTGLDVGAQRQLWSYLYKLRQEQGVTIALTTHLMEEADRCDRLAFLADGRLVTIDTPGNLKARIGGDVVTVEPNEAHADSLTQAIAGRFGPWAKGASPTLVDYRIRFEKPDGAKLVPALIATFPDQINSVTVGRPTLEDVFMHLTGQRLWQ